MSNEPNEAERYAAIDIYGTLIENDAFSGATSTEVTPSQIAHIIAAHRADESELAKALETLAHKWQDAANHPPDDMGIPTVRASARSTSITFSTCARELRAALAAHDAAKA